MRGKEESGRDSVGSRWRMSGLLLVSLEVEGVKEGAAVLEEAASVFEAV